MTLAAMSQDLRIKWQNKASTILEQYKDYYPENAKDWHEGLVKDYAEKRVQDAKTARIR